MNFQRVETENIIFCSLTYDFGASIPATLFTPHLPGPKIKETCLKPLPQVDLIVYQID